MNLALCYESVLPARGGCEMYIADLARRLVADGHQVHVYACRWDESALPAGIVYHRLPAATGPRFLRPWRFSAACSRALAERRHDASIGFDKTLGPDIAYPLGGVHAASADHNLSKHRRPWLRGMAGLVKQLDLAHQSFVRLERRLYGGPRPPLIVANSALVRRHFERYLGVPPERVRVVRSAIHPDRFVEDDRPRRRADFRRKLGIRPGETVAAFVAMNYRLKGLEPLLHAVGRLPADRPFRLLVAGSPRTRPYQALAARLGVADRVCFAGFCPDTRDCYFAADLLVHPTFYDPCSLVVLEALACGLPVITSRFNGASELLHPPREGYVIDDPHNHGELAWWLTQLLDPVRRAACSQAARQAARRWTFDDHYRQMLGIFDEAARRHHAA
jgi:UDP-glucose:(heptosyl)LPS alpha-1,3-glucosyltransferase